MDYGAMRLNTRWRRRFDRILEKVLADLPPRIHELLDEVPLRVEDYPSKKTMRELGAQRRDELCGIFTGIPLTERMPSLPFELPPFVTLYREGILAATRELHGRITPRTLREQIRVTLLHELAHYHGLDEEDLEELGYA